MIGFSLILPVLCSFSVPVNANFTNLQIELMEMKQEVRNLQILVSDLRTERQDLR